MERRNRKRQRKRTKGGKYSRKARATISSSSTDPRQPRRRDEHDDALPSPNPENSSVQAASTQQDPTNQPIPGAFAVQGGTIERRTADNIPEDDGQDTYTSEQHPVEEEEALPPLLESPISAVVAPNVQNSQSQVLHNLREELDDLRRNQQDLERQQPPNQLELVRAETVQVSQDHADGQDNFENDLPSSNVEKPKKPWQRRTFWILCVAALAAIAGGVTVAVVMSQGSNKGSGSNHTNNPTTPFPTPVPTNPPPTLPSGPWEQLGQDLNGIGPNDRAGYSVTLSKDASVVAVASPENSSRPGRVVVYHREASSWTQMGQELMGQDNDDLFGLSVSLNGAGSILSIGAIQHDSAAGMDSGQVRVFEYSNSTSQWQLLGDPINGEASEDGFGVSVSLSDSGLVLAIGASFADSSNGGNTGSVRLFQFNRTDQTWQQFGQALVGEKGNDAFGFSVSLSSSGLIVAIGAVFGFSGRGEVSVFAYNSGSSTWIVMGNPLHPINEPISLDEFGRSVSLDDSGLIVAVGAWISAGISVFAFDNATSSWTRRGATLASQFGYSVSLSSDGNVLAAGDIYHDGNGLQDSGCVRIFEYDKSNTMEWVQVGADIVGETAGDRAGWSVSLSGNGTAVAIGSPLNGGTGEDSGHVRVYTLTN